MQRSWVRLGKQERHCRLVVVAGKGPSFLGRDWLKMFRIQWHQINALVTPRTINSKGITENKGVADKVEAMVNGFPEVFKS